jgi:GntR family transcriptional regulator/MocR family aminotransferase
MKQRAGVPMPLFAGIGGDDVVPLYRRAYGRLRDMILRGVLAANHRLPSSRTLATDLGVSRNTVEAAFAQLEAEGYITRKVGSGSYVSAVLPQRPSDTGRRGAKHPRHTGDQVALSKRGRLMALPGPTTDADGDATFGVCRPGIDVFPFELWNRLAARRGRRLDRRLLDEAPAAGLPALRHAVAAYVSGARGVRCEPSQVIVVSSTQQALDLLARLLLDPRDQAWVEEPCYVGATAALRNAGARMVPVRVDERGLDVDAGIRAAPAARLVYVTPSHQFPLGVTMSAERRLALLSWAERANAWIIEDDYDSEFRYVGRPLAALQGLDAHDRVVYVGTLNKVMFPSLRLAYVVLPPSLVEAVRRARQWHDGHASAMTQAVMADFITAGHFGQHIRTMRGAYQERRDALCAAIANHAAGRITLGVSDAGMHVAAWLPRGTDVPALRERAATKHLYLRDIATYYARRPPQPGLVLNFGSSPPTAIRGGVATLAALL